MQQSKLKYRRLSRALQGLAAIAVVGLLPVLSAAKSSRKAPTPHPGYYYETDTYTPDQRKADYIFMEALKQNALNNDDAYFELMRRAYALEPSDTYTGMNLGYYMMAIGNQDTVMSRKGYDMMRANFDAHPANYYDAIFYGMVNNRLGNTDESIRVWATLDSLHPDKPDIAMRLAEALQQSGDSANLRRSIAVLNRIERAEGVDVGLSSNKVRALVALKDTTGTLAEVDHLLSSGKPNATNLIYAGDVNMALERSDSAMAYYNRACALDPTNGLGYYKRAQFYRQTGDSIGFDREVFEAVRQEGLDLDMKMEIFKSYIGQLFNDTIQRPRIEALFADLLSQYPHEADLRDLYASYFIATDDYKSAAEQEEIALDTDMANPDRWRATIMLYGQANLYDKAIEIGCRGIDRLPDDAMIRFYTGNALSLSGKGKEALEELKAALKVVAENDRQTESIILCSIGDELYKQHQPDSAVVYYERAMDANPDNLTAINNYAYFMAEQGMDLDRAETLSAITVRQEPANDTALDTSAWILFKKKEYTRAKEIIDRALKIEEDNPQADVLNHAGDIYYMNGDPEAALDFWTRALELDPDNALLKKKVKNKTHFYE